MPLPTLLADPTHFEAILAALPGNFILLLPDAPTFTIVAMSAELLRQTDRQAAQVVGQSVFVAYPENPAEIASNGPTQMRTALETSLRDHQPHDLPLVRYDVPTANGRFEERYWSGRSQAVLDAQGTVRYLLFTSQDITTQLRAANEQRAVQQAAESEARFQVFVAQAPVAITLTRGPEVVIEAINEPMLRLINQPAAAAVLGRRMVEVLPELEAQPILHIVQQVTATGQAFRGSEVPITLRAQSELQPGFFNVSYTPFIEQGQVTGVIHVAVDVTEQVRARQQAEALQAELLAAAQHQVQARETFYRIFEQTPAAICIQRGPEHRYEYTNPAYQAFFPGRQLLGQTVADALPETVDSGVVALLDHVYETGETYYGEELPLLIAQPDGRPPRQMYFTFTYQALRENGQIVGISTFAYNVAEQVLARQQREAERQQLYGLFMQAPAPICILDGPDLVYQLVNPAYQRIFPGRELLGKPLATALPELLDSPVPALLRQVYETGETYVAQELRLQMARHNGGPLDDIYCTFTYQARRNAAGAIDGILVFVYDITDQVRARQSVEQNEQRARTLSQELATSNEQLRRTNVDLDNFIYTASHDLKAPIANIEGLLHAIEQELPPAGRVGQVPHMLRLMQQSVERFGRTIGHLTDISRLQQAHDQAPSLVSLARVVHEVQLDLTPLIAQSQAQVTVDVPADATLNFSEKNLRSIVFNLLSNALKYRHPDRPPAVVVAYAQQAAAHVLEVRDNGLGLNLAQDEAKLFGVFKRLHGHVEGTGVGLYMVKKIIENAGGHIEVESALDQGSTFRVFFPC